MEALQQWFKDNGGYIHPSTQLSREDEFGTLLRATEAIDEGTTIITGPHSLSLSVLNAMVDDTNPVFKENANAFTVEALGFFYLMAQWLSRDKSFWKPYLDTLPSPEEGFGTPNFFDDDDLKWIEGTDLHLVYVKRKDVWEQYWREGVIVLERHGVDSKPYTCKYWTAYKTGPHGRQTVLLDFSKVPSERKDFPVLFPTVDTLNHDPTTPIEWSFDPGRFTLRTLIPNAAGAQIYNNYGPKANGELLMGYGFCLSNNAHDGVLETLKPPPEALQHLLRKSHPGYFKINGDWNSEAATFHLRAPPPSIATDTTAIWSSIPDPLIELFYYIIRLERGLPVNTIDPHPSASSPPPQPQNPATNDTHIHTYLFSGPGQSYLPRIAFAIVTSLVPKMTKLSTATANLPSSQPTNRNQRNAQIYRDGQMDIMTSIREGLSAYNRSLRPPVETEKFTGSAIWSLEEVFAVMRREAPAAWDQFATGIFGSDRQDGKVFRGTPLERDTIWILWICYITILADPERTVEPSCKEGLIVRWVNALREEYGEPFVEDEGEEEDAVRLLGAADGAAVRTDVHDGRDKDSVWRSPRWNSAFVLDWGMRVVQSQGMMMRCGEDDVRFVVYLHVEA
ncbi:hypothetical protein MBLNU457_g1095t2 [Dothideomycetes sp. NU457]